MITLLFVGFPLNRRLTKKKVVPIQEEKKDGDKTDSSSRFEPELAKGQLAKPEDGDVQQENVVTANDQVPANDQVRALVDVGSDNQEHKRLKFENKSDYFRDG